MRPPSPPEPPDAPTRGELLARGGGLVVLMAGGTVLGAASSPARAAARGELATVRLLLAGEVIAIAFYARAVRAGVLPPAAAVQAQRALENERDHDAALREAAGGGAEGTRARLSDGPLGDADAAMASAMALESALLAAYLGAAAALASADLRGLAAAIGANEAQHLDALRWIVAGEPVAGPALPVAAGPERARAALGALAAGRRLL